MNRGKQGSSILGCGVQGAAFYLMLFVLVMVVCSPVRVCALPVQMDKTIANASIDAVMTHDVNGDSKEDIVLSDHENRMVHVIDGSTGLPLSGWPVALSEAYSKRPAFYEGEMYVVTPVGLRIYDSSGSLVTTVGLPLPGIESVSMPILDDVNGDGKADILLSYFKNEDVDENNATFNLVMVIIDGKTADYEEFILDTYENYSYNNPSPPPISTDIDTYYPGNGSPFPVMAVGDITGDGSKEVVVHYIYHHYDYQHYGGAYNHLYETDHKNVSVFSLSGEKIAFHEKLYYSTPQLKRMVLYDSDGDGDLEIITGHAESNFFISIFDYTGSGLSETISFPENQAYNAGNACMGVGFEGNQWIQYTAVKDYSYSGEYSIISRAFLSGSDEVVSGWPVKEPLPGYMPMTYAVRNILTLDVDGDEELDSVRAYYDKLYCYSKNGDEKWVHDLPDETCVDPVTEDVDGDCNLEIITVIGGNRLIVLGTEGSVYCDGDSFANSRNTAVLGDCVDVGIMSVAITSPDNGSTVSSSEGFVLEGIASDGDGIDYVEICIMNRIIEEGNYANFFTAYRQAVDTYDSSTGKWTYSVSAEKIYDSAEILIWAKAVSNSGEYKYAVVRVKGSDETKPEIAITSPAGESIVSSGGFTVTGTVFDQSDIERIQVYIRNKKIYANGTVQYSWTAYGYNADSYNPATGAWAYNVSSDQVIFTAELSIWARAEDECGNKSNYAHVKTYVYGK